MEYPLTHKQFYGALKQGVLLGLKCKSCGAYTVPPRMCCAECQGTKLEIEQLSGRGEIQTFTVVRVAPKGFEPPYVVVLVKLEEGPLLMGNLPDADPGRAERVIIGRKVKLEAGVILSGEYSAGEGVAAAFSLV